MSLFWVLALLAPTEVDTVDCTKANLPLHRLACYDQQQARGGASERAGFVDAYSGCERFSGAQERLACFDRIGQPLNGVQLLVPGSPNAGDDDEIDYSAKPRYVRFVVRNDALPYPNPNAEFGPKGASVTYQRDDGDEYVSGNVSVMAIINRNESSANYRPGRRTAWQPYVFGQWKRKENADDKTDVRTAGAGLAIVRSPKDYASGTGLNIWPAVYSRRNLYTDTRSDVAVVHVDVIRPCWYSADLETTTATAYTYKPFFGTLGEHRSTPGTPDGNWTSGYAGLQATWRLNRITPRLEALVTWQYFADFRSPDGTDRRREDYGKFGVKYRLTDPADKKVRWRPAVELTREIGINPLVGSDRISQTTLALTIEADTW